MTDEAGSNEWRGRFFEDLKVGDVFRSRLGRTITEADNTWFTLLTMNTNELHFNRAYAERTRFGRPLVVSTLSLAIVLGLSVADTSENAAANLGWSDIKLLHPVYAEDTLWAESEVLEVRPSRTNDEVGLVTVRTRGINQRREVVLEYRRSFMVYRRSAPAVVGKFPVTDAGWSV